MVTVVKIVGSSALSQKVIWSELLMSSMVEKLMARKSVSLRLSKMNGTLGVVVPIHDLVRVLVPDVGLRLEGPAPAQLPGHDPVPDLDALVPLVAGDPDLDEMTRENF